MEYDFQIEDAIRVINREKPRIVCVQLPDGLKPKAVEIAGILEKKTKAMVVIWMGSCFGACDIPLELKNLGVDLLIHFGHSSWPFWEERIKVF